MFTKLVVFVIFKLSLLGNYLGDTFPTKGIRVPWQLNASKNKNPIFAGAGWKPGRYKKVQASIQDPLWPEIRPLPFIQELL